MSDEAEKRIVTPIIEKNIAIPSIEKGRGTPRYSLRADIISRMSVGDSVLFKVKHNAYALQHFSKTKGFIMTTRKMQDGYRVWLVEGSKVRSGL